MTSQIKLGAASSLTYCLAMTSAMVTSPTSFDEAFHVNGRSLLPQSRSEEDMLDLLTEERLERHAAMHAPAQSWYEEDMEGMY